MTKNMGTIDRTLRAVLGVLLVVLPFATGLTAGSAIFTYGAVAVGIVMLVTSVTGICPLYTALGLKTSSN